MKKAPSPYGIYTSEPKRRLAVESVSSSFRSTSQRSSPARMAGEYFHDSRASKSMKKRKLLFNVEAESSDTGGESDDLILETDDERIEENVRGDIVGETSKNSEIDGGEADDLIIEMYEERVEENVGNVHTILDEVPVLSSIDEEIRRDDTDETTDSACTGDELRRIRSIKDQISYLNRETNVSIDDAAQTTDALALLLRQFHSELCSDIRRIAHKTHKFTVLNRRTIRELVDSRALIALWNKVNIIDFWNLLFPLLCNIVFFTKVPQKGDDEEFDLFSEELALGREIPKFVINDDCEKATVDSRHSSFPAFQEKRQKLTDEPCGDKNDRVYNKMWPLFIAVTRYFNKLVWRMIDREITSTDERVVRTIEQAFENAMICGHVLLAAPLSVYAPLVTVNALSDMHTSYLESTHDVPHFGQVYTRNILYSLLAAIQYMKFTRGLRPCRIWINDKCPLFLIRHMALCLYNFREGFVDGGFKSHNTAYDPQILKRRILNFCYNSPVATSQDFDVDGHSSKQTTTNPLARYFKLIVYDSNNVYKCADFLQHPNGRYLNLLKPHLSNDAYFVNREITQRREWNRRNDLWETHMQNLIDPIEEEEVNSTLSVSLLLCNGSECIDGMENIVKSEFLNITEKHEVLSDLYVNLLILFSSCLHNEELLRFQLNGMSNFPQRLFSVTKYSATLRHLYSLYTVRLISNLND